MGLQSMAVGRANSIVRIYKFVIFLLPGVCKNEKAILNSHYCNLFFGVNI
jgi:hypothetical protein